MNKKSDEELGVLLTREILNMMANEKLTAEQRLDLFNAIVFDKEAKDPVLGSFAESLKTGYNYANDARKASIYSRRDRQMIRLRTSTEIGVDGRTSLIKGKGNVNGKGNNPLPPKGGKGENDEPHQISPEDIISDAAWADGVVADLMKWYPKEVNHDRLKKTLILKFKKGLRRALEDGLAAWMDSGAWDNERFIPPDIVKWIKLERFLDTPPNKKNSAAREEARGSLVPSSDATMAMLMSNREE